MEDKNLHGKWIAITEKLNSCYIKKNIEICNIQKAKILITGLGFFELYINGQRVGEDICVPAWTNYCYRDLSKKLLYPCHDTFNYRVCYLEYDLNGLLKEGNNEIVIQLANGWYRQNKRNVEGDLVYGDYLLTNFVIYVLDKNGKCHEFFSDGSEVFALSEIVDTNVYYGEIQDYSVDYLKKNTDFKSVQVVEFDSKLVKQIAPTDKVVEKICLEKIERLSKTKQVFGLPVSITGRVVIKCLSDNVTVRYSEEINDGELDFESSGGEYQIQTDLFKNAKNKIVYSKFSIHCFRYFEIEGDAEIVCIERINSDIKQTITLSTNNEILNWIFDSYIRTQLCNMHYGVPSDCPHRERLGYTGDAQLTAESALLTLDSIEFYKKWLDDVLDCQDVVSGHVQHTAPFYGGGGGPVGWGGAIAILPLKLYKITGDISFINKNISYVSKWFDYIISNLENDLIVKEVEGGWCLGDWCVPSSDIKKPPEVLIPAPFVNGCMFVKILQEYLSLNERGLTDFDHEKYSLWAEKIKRSIVANFYDAEKNDFCGGKQGANLFAADIGLANENIINKTVDFYKRTKSFDTGIFGTEILVRFLCERDVQAAFDLLVSENDNTFYSMMKNGASTLYENWNGFGSHNHPMFGGCVKDIIYSVLGIKFIDGREKIVINPPKIDGLDYFTIDIKMNKGFVKIDYNKTDVQTIKVLATNSDIFVVDSEYKNLDNNVYEKN